MEEPIGTEVRAMRSALGLTQAALGALAGMSQSRVANIEAGRDKGSGPKARRGLARAFGLSLDDLDAYLGRRITLAAAVQRAKRRVA
jgi:transcriptional regulator with XRE-family HTH domain